ncbi:MAG: hypothetical protein RQ741_05230 [Wenzhouxiangellaceae bacterium]|nr:hypothetical protein [Wenzhouxiangellaceae bacterium]
MRYRSVAATLLIGLMAATAFTPANAHFEDYLEYRLMMNAHPDVYYLFEDDRKQVVSYKTERVVRICTGDSRHLVPLKVIYDDKTATVEKNDCIRVEAKEVALEPAKLLETGEVIRAEVDTLN